jgi:hypothetical protein
MWIAPRRVISDCVMRLFKQYILFFFPCTRLHHLKHTHTHKRHTCAGCTPNKGPQLSTRDRSTSPPGAGMKIEFLHGIAIGRRNTTPTTLIDVVETEAHALDDDFERNRMLINYILIN